MAILDVEVSNLTKEYAILNGEKIVFDEPFEELPSKADFVAWFTKKNLAEELEIQNAGDDWRNMSDNDFDKLILRIVEIESQTHEGAGHAEKYFAGPYKQQWHEIWRDGRLANEQGKSRECNPQKLKVWRAVWEYGWDNYDPNQPFGEFAIVENYLNHCPTRPMNAGDI